jgi:hypothetical protein
MADLLFRAGIKIQYKYMLASADGMMNKLIRKFDYK